MEGKNDLRVRENKVNKVHICFIILAFISQDFKAVRGYACILQTFESDHNFKAFILNISLLRCQYYQYSNN
jgi:hypothetical protein